MYDLFAESIVAEDAVEFTTELPRAASRLYFAGERKMLKDTL